MKSLLLMRILLFFRFPFEKIVDLILIPTRALMFGFLYLNFLKGRTLNGYTSSDIMLWVIFTSVISMLLPSISSEIENEILNGNIVIKLTRPLGYRIYFFVYYLGDFFFYLCIIVFSMILIRPEVLSQIPLVVLLLFSSYTIHFIFEMFIGYTTIWLGRIWWLKIVLVNVIILFGGGFFPIKWFPKEIFRVIDLLPFKFIYAVPLEVILGKKINLFMIAIESSFWILTLLILLGIFERKFLKNLIVFGG